MPPLSSSQKGQAIKASVSELKPSQYPPAPPVAEDLSGSLTVLATPNPVTTSGKVTFSARGKMIDSLKVTVYDGTGNRVYASSLVEGSHISWNLTTGQGRPRLKLGP